MVSVNTTEGLNRDAILEQYKNVVIPTLQAEIRRLNEVIENLTEKD